MRHLLTLLTLLFTITLSGPALAEQPILSISGATLSTTTQQYSAVGGNAVITTTVDDGSYPRVSAAGELSQLYVHLSAAPGAGTSRTFTLRVNNSNSALTCTIADTAIDCSDTSNAVTVAPNDIISFTYTLSGSPTAATAGFGIRWVPTTPGQQVFMSRTGSVSGVAKSFAPFQHGNLITFNTTESVVTQHVGAAGTFSNMYVGASAGPGSGGDAYTIAPSIGGVDQDVDCTFADAATTCSDTSDDFPVTQDQLLSIGATPAVTPGSPVIGVGLRFVPTTAGDFFSAFVSGNADSNSAQQYMPPGGARNMSNVESAAVVPFPGGGPWYINRIHVSTTDPNPGSRAFTLRKGTAGGTTLTNTGLTCTISSGNTSCTGTGQITFSSGDLVSLTEVPSSTPATGLPKVTLTGTTVPPVVPPGGSLLLMGCCN